jgi:hypothetical protein
MVSGGPTPETTFVIDEHINCVLQVFSGDESNHADRGLSYLHLAALQGDLPLAYESFRLGTSIHCKNKDGQSALFFACEMLSRLMPHGKPIVIGAPTEFEEQLARMCRVCLPTLRPERDAWD